VRGPRSHAQGRPLKEGILGTLQTLGPQNGLQGLGVVGWVWYCLHPHTLGGMLL
jgi:hypothetical protein